MEYSPLWPIPSLLQLSLSATTQIVNSSREWALCLQTTGQKAKRQLTTYCIEMLLSKIETSVARDKN